MAAIVDTDFERVSNESEPELEEDEEDEDGISVESDSGLDDPGASGEPRPCNHREHQPTGPRRLSHRTLTFEKQRRLDDVKLPPTVKVLEYPSESQWTSLGEDVSVVEGGDQPADIASHVFHGARIYLVGTAHFSRESQQDVIKTIEQTQPDVVMVELCASRAGVLHLDEEELTKQMNSLDTAKVIDICKKQGVIAGVLNTMLLSMSAHVAKELGMAPGGEFRAAKQALANYSGGHLVFGDRPLNVTLQRAFASLSFWQRLKFAWAIIASHNSKISQEDVEKCKQGDLLEELLKEMAGEFPEFSRILIQERDEFMSVYLRSMLRQFTLRKLQRYTELKRHNDQLKWEPVIGVAVIGIGHQPGIIANWNRNDIDMHQLLTIPVQSSMSRYTRMALRGAAFSVASYVIYKLGKATYRGVRSLL